MKRLILMGGRPWTARDGGEEFAEVLMRYFAGEIKLAFCIFAQPESDWGETERANTAMFERFAGKKRLQYQTMTPENFEKVSAWADVIYLPGGNSHHLSAQLAKHPNLAKLWDGKVIAGSSAGAVTLCAAYIYLQERTFGKGLGWVAASCIPHWRDQFEDYTDADWDFAETELLKRYPKLPLLCIPEGQFVEVTVQ